MNENEARKCPKCGSEMELVDKIVGYGLHAARLFNKYDLSRGDKIIPYYCPNCGYIELYNEKYLRYYYERAEARAGKTS